MGGALILLALTLGVAWQVLELQLDDLDLLLQMVNQLTHLLRRDLGRVQRHEALLLGLCLARAAREEHKRLIACYL